MTRLDGAKALRDSIATEYPDPDSERFVRHYIADPARWPTWLLHNLGYSTKLAPLGPSPNFAYIYAELPWPSLLEQNPHEITAEGTDAVLSPSWSAVADAFTLLQTVGARPFLCVNLSLGAADQIRIVPIALHASTPTLGAPVRAEVCDFLTCGQPARAHWVLRQRCDPIAWTWHPRAMYSKGEQPRWP